MAFNTFKLSAHGRLRLKCDGTRAETRFRLSAKRTNPFKSAGVSIQSTTGSRGVRISGSNVGYIMFRCSVRVLATHSIHQFPLHFPSRASSCAITFQLDSTSHQITWTRVPYYLLLLHLLLSTILLAFLVSVLLFVLFSFILVLLEFLFHSLLFLFFFILLVTTFSIF
jgi:hypothetical protein